MSNTVTWIIKAQDQFTKVAKDINLSIINITNNINKLDRAVEKTALTMHQRFSRLKSSIKDVGQGLMTLSAPLAAVGVGALHAASKYQQLLQSFTSMRGSVKGAREELRTIQQFARKSPFTFFDVARSEKLLRQSGVGRGSILKVMGEVGDISAGAGLPLGRLSAILAKVVSRKYIQTREANQLLAYHIDLVGSLAKRYRLTRMQVMAELSKRGHVPSSVLFETFEKDYTGKGKMFHDQMIKQMTTIGGSFNKMKEGFEVGGIFLGLFINKVLNLSQKMYAVGNILQDKIAPFFEFFTLQRAAMSNFFTKKNAMNEFFDNLKKNNPVMHDFLTGIQKNYPWLQSFSGTIIKIVNALIILDPVLYGIVKLGDLLKVVFGPLGKILMFSYKAARLFTLALVAGNPWAIAITAIAALGAGVYYFLTQTELGRQALIKLKQEFIAVDNWFKSRGKDEEKRHHPIWSSITDFFGGRRSGQFANAYTMGYASKLDSPNTNLAKAGLLPKQLLDLNINLTGNTDAVGSIKFKGEGATVKINKLGKNMAST